MDVASSQYRKYATNRLLSLLTAADGAQQLHTYISKVKLQLTIIRWKMY